MVHDVQLTQEKSVKIAASSRQNGADCASELAQHLGEEDYAFLLVFFSPGYASGHLTKSLKNLFPRTPIYGCSTAGELSPTGLVDGTVVVLGFLATDFQVSDVFFPNLDEFSIRDGQFDVRGAVKKFQTTRSSDKPHCFALMLVDGLCYREEQLVSAINYGLRDIPLIGGSAGDGLNFKETHIVHHGELVKNGAVLLLVESRCPLHIFKCDSFSPTDLKFVVTKADPENRLVYELNAMPAALAYANALGMEPEELDLLNFASHPLSVCFGGDCYVRSIKEVHPDGAFSFYCAIDEGIVFTLSEVGNMVEGIENTIQQIHEDIGQPQLILGFDCVLRRMIGEINQSKGQISQLFQENQVIGFNTYGEQVHAMHLNLTFSGIAIGQ